MFFTSFRALLLALLPVAMFLCSVTSVTKLMLLPQQDFDDVADRS